MLNLTAREVAKALRAQPHSGGWIACCPAHDDSKPSLTIRDGRNGLLLHCWAGCEFTSIARAIEAITGEGEAGPRESVAETHSHTAGSLGRVQAALRMWEAAGPLCEVSKRYLERRGILSAPGAANLRSAALKHPDGTMAQAILAPRMNEPGRVTGIQRTFLDEADCTKYRDGEPKLSLGEGMFSMLGQGEHVLLAEGMENALSAEILAKIPGSVPWACLKGFPKQRLTLSPDIKSVRLIVDHDRSGVSQGKSKAFAEANNYNTFKVYQWCPPKVGQDANDFLQETMK